jgi:hypothetical protein
MRQPFVTPSAVEAFDVRVLLRLAKFDVFEADTPDLAQASMAGLMYSGPLSQRIAWGLRANASMLSNDSNPRSATTTSRRMCG